MGITYAPVAPLQTQPIAARMPSSSSSSTTSARVASRAPAKARLRFSHRRGDVLDKLVYTATNPVLDHLVERVHHWPANPDLVERLRNDWPLATAERKTYYGGSDIGYTDYAAMPGVSRQRLDRRARCGGLVLRYRFEQCSRRVRMLWRYRTARVQRRTPRPTGADASEPSGHPLGARSAPASRRSASPCSR